MVEQWKVKEDLKEEIAEKNKRNYRRRFKKNLEKLIGFDASEYLKSNNHYQIPRRSIEFVKKILEPDDKFNAFINKRYINEGIGVLEKIDEKKVNQIIEWDKYLNKIRDDIWYLFGECEQKNLDEVMLAFFKKYFV